MRLVYLTAAYDRKSTVAINPDRVAYVETYGGMTRLRFSGLEDDFADFSEPFDEVTERLLEVA